MKTKKRYYHFIVEVLVFDHSINAYKHWFSESFSSIVNYHIWYAGFFAGVDHTNPKSHKIGSTSVKYFSFKPRF